MGINEIEQEITRVCGVCPHYRSRSCGENCVVPDEIRADVLYDVGTCPNDCRACPAVRFDEVCLVEDEDGPEDLLTRHQMAHL